MSNRAFVIVVVTVALLLAGVVYMHRPRNGQARQLPPSLHGVR